MVWAERANIASQQGEWMQELEVDPDRQMRTSPW